MKHILAALDLSPHADRVFARSTQLAEQHGAVLTVVHIVNPGPCSQAVRLDEAQRRAALVLQQFSPPGLMKGHLHVGTGIPSAEIAKLAYDRDADLIVLGMHHRHPIRDMLVDTISQRILKKYRLSILVACSRVSGPYGRVLVTSDFSESANRTLHAATLVAPTAEFHVLHAFETPFPKLVHFTPEELSELKEAHCSHLHQDWKMHRHPVSGLGADAPNIHVENDEIDLGITRVIHKAKPELLAMGLGKHSDAIGSRTLAYLNSPPCDVIVAANHGPGRAP